MGCLRACCAPSRLAFVNGSGAGGHVVCLPGSFVDSAGTLLLAPFVLTGLCVFASGAPLLEDGSGMGGKGSRALLPAAKFGVDLVRALTRRPWTGEPLLCGGIAHLDLSVVLMVAASMTYLGRVVSTWSRCETRST